MKKVMLSLAALAMVVCFASCKKTCDCKSYGNSYEYTLEELQDAYSALGEINSCADVAEVTYDVMKCE